MTMAKVAQRHIKGWLTTLPPLDEQDRIIEHIRQIGERTDELLGSCGAMTEGLQERRTALISAAVTGKIDVRGWKAPEAEIDTAP